jgi:hypothetical protein
VDQIAEVMLQSVRQDLARGDVVAVAEPTGETEDLVPSPQRRVLDQTVDVHPLGDRPGPLEGMGRFVIAIRSGGAKD